MQDKPIVHGECTKEQFDLRVVEVSSGLVGVQQEIQNLLNIAYAYATDPSCNDYTFCTKLYVTMSDKKRLAIKASKIKGCIEKFAGATWDKDAANGGQFKKDRTASPDPTAGVLASNAWWCFETKTEGKPWDAHAFFTRTTKTVNTKGAKDEFKRNDAEQLALDALISALHNEGFEINIPEPKHQAPTLDIPDWQKQVEEAVQIAA